MTKKQARAGRDGAVCCPTRERKKKPQRSQPAARVMTAPQRTLGVGLGALADQLQRVHAERLERLNHFLVQLIHLSIDSEPTPLTPHDATTTTNATDPSLARVMRLHFFVRCHAGSRCQ